MQQQRRVLVVGRSTDDMETVTARLEGSGYSVTGTLYDDIAIDLAASSEFDALLMVDMRQKERTGLRGEVMKKQKKIKVVQAEGTESVLTLLKQALR